MEIDKGNERDKGSDRDRCSDKHRCGGRETQTETWREKMNEDMSVSERKKDRGINQTTKNLHRTTRSFSVAVQHEINKSY